MAAATAGASYTLATKQLKAVTKEEQAAKQEAFVAKNKHTTIVNQLNRATKDRKAQERKVHKNAQANLKPGISISEAQKQLKLSK